MSDSSKNPRKGGEQELADVITWLKTELTVAEQLKKEKINEAARRLKELGFRKDWIASTIAEHSEELGVSRGYIYEALNDEYKSKRRSEAQKEAKARALSQIPDLEDQEPQEVIVGADGHSFGDALNDEDGEESATKAWKEAAESRNQTLDAWIPAVESIIQSAVLDGEYVRVPKEVWEKFKKVADQALS